MPKATSYLNMVESCKRESFQRFGAPWRQNHWQYPSLLENQRRKYDTPDSKQRRNLLARDFLKYLPLPDLGINLDKGAEFEPLRSSNYGIFYFFLNPSILDLNPLQDPKFSNPQWLS